MFELMMTYCLVGQPCTNESVANFPQYDVGRHICELAKPGIELGVRSRLPAGARVTFKCQEAVGSGQVEYEYEQPRQSQPAGVLEQVAPRLIQEATRYLQR